MELNLELITAGVIGLGVIILLIIAIIVGRTLRYIKDLNGGIDALGQDTRAFSEGIRGMSRDAKVFSEGAKSLGQEINLLSQDASMFAEEVKALRENLAAINEKQK